MSYLVVALTALVATNASPPQQAPQHQLKDDADRIRNALSAAPATITRDATIMTMEGDKMRVIKQGKGEFTRIPNDPTSPGNDPMCLDKNAMEWFHALVEHKEPPKGKAGLVFMLQGGSEASNDDPWATTPPNGNWIETGPYAK
jgi:hypothetical protein